MSKAIEFIERCSYNDTSEDDGESLEFILTSDAIHATKIAQKETLLWVENLLGANTPPAILNKINELKKIKV